MDRRPRCCRSPRRRRRAGSRSISAQRRRSTRSGSTASPAPFLKRLALEGERRSRALDVARARRRCSTFPPRRLRAGHRCVHARRRTGISGLPGTTRTAGGCHCRRVVRARRLVERVRSTPGAASTLPFEREPSEPGRSRYRIRLPGRVSSSRRAEARQSAGGHVFRHCHRHRIAIRWRAKLPRSTLGTRDADAAWCATVSTASDLRMPDRAAERNPRSSSQIDDGSNPPLEMSRILLQLAELPWIYFESRRRGIRGALRRPCRRAAVTTISRRCGGRST